MEDYATQARREFLRQAQSESRMESIAEVLGLTLVFGLLFVATVVLFHVQ